MWVAKAALRKWKNSIRSFDVCKTLKMDDDSGDLKE